MEEIQELIRQEYNYGYFDVECECGEEYRVEPDAEFECTMCGETVMSPLVALGLY